MKNEILKATQILKRGGLIGLPTETVYGLAADATNPAAIRKIFQAKQRPIDHPLIVHLGAIAQLEQYASEIPEAARQLAHAFWPGPLTLVLKKSPAVLDLVTGGQDTVGLRMPNHPVAQAVLTAFGGAVVAPSANRFGRISPTTAAAVYEELGEKVDLILEGGQCAVGLESTIVDLSSGAPSILRPGMISAAALEKVLQQKVITNNTKAPRVSGSFESHYAPLTKTILMPADAIENYLKNKTTKIAVMAINPLSARENLILQKMPSNPLQYAHDLYFCLRELDHLQVAEIIIEDVPNNIEWQAVKDRLVRAANK